MAQFTLAWINTDIVSNTNVTAQRASYRAKAVGGNFITSGFSVSNDLAKNVNTVDSPTLSDNKVYEFKIESICTTNGPTINDNGIQEGINFANINPTLSKTYNSGGISIDLTGLDITKVRFTLKKASDNSLVVPTIIINKANNAVILGTTGLTGNTNYYWEAEYFATINNVEVVSSASAYLGTKFSPFPFTTDADPVCNPVTSVTVTSIEIA